MTRILKFVIRHNVAGIQFVNMPYNARVISAIVQHGEVSIYAICSDNSEVTHTFQLIETGCKAPVNATYIATLSFENGEYIVHLFDHGEKQ